MNSVLEVTIDNIDFFRTPYKGIFISRCGKVLSTIGRNTASIRSAIYNNMYFIRSPYINNRGYLSIRTPIGHFKVHRLLALTFIPKSENKDQVNHIDCNKLNNSLENLEWVNCKENVHHAIANGSHIAVTGRTNKIKNTRHCGHPSKFKKAVEDSNGNIFASVTDAAKHYEIKHKSSLSRSIRNAITYKGIHFKYTKEIQP